MNTRIYRLWGRELAFHLIKQGNSLTVYMTEDCAGALVSMKTEGGGGVAVGVDATEALLAFALNDPIAPSMLLFVREEEPLL